MMEFTKLFNEIIDQASFFLKENEEFYPFGWVIENDHSSHPLSVYFGKEYPTSAEMISELENVLLQKVETDKCIAVAICLDVTYQPQNQTRTNAIEIRIDSIENRINYILCYQIADGEVKFGELYGENGTLQIYKN